MHRLLMSMMVVGMVLGSVAQAADPSLLCWWKMDGNLTNAGSTGAANDGTAFGDAATYATGQLGQAWSLNGTNQYADCGTLDLGTNGTGGISLCAWINRPSTGIGGDHKVLGNRNGNTGFKMTVYGNASGSSTKVEMEIYDAAGQLLTRNGGTPTGTVINSPDTWYHIACVFDDSADQVREYINGVLDSTTATTKSLVSSTSTLRLGQEVPSVTAGRYYLGLLDDVRIYNKALTASDLEIVMKGGDRGAATSASPSDKATDVVRDVVLGWKAGEFAQTHNVYFGTNFDDVNTATVAQPKGVLVAAGQDANTFDPAGVLAYGQTYYWRVDEVNAPPTNSTIFTGTTWRFTVETLVYTMRNITATASSSYDPNSGPDKTVNNVGVNSADQHSTEPAQMWLSGAEGPQWIQYQFDGLYKLQQMWVWNSNQSVEPILGFGVKTATVEYSADGITWTALANVPEFAQATGLPDYAYSTTIDFGGVAVQYVKITPTASWGGWPQYSLSEVRFFYTPVQAREPKPATNATGVSPDVTLNWRAGREAASHNVYMGTDPNALTPAATTSDKNYIPAGLTLGTKYYWRIDEVNTAEALSTWASATWNFTTLDFVVVDNMDSYTDEEGKAIFNTWTDGYNTNTNGALVGYDMAPYAEKTTIHGGKQSMPFRYGQNAAATSEVTQTFAAQDWTYAGIKTLTLFFYGDPNNAAAQLYVKINGTKIAYAGDAGNIQRARWNQWNVDLSAVAATTLKGVTSLVIGVSNSGAGKLLIDDIRLYRVAPAIPVPTNPGTTGLLAYYNFENSVQDASGNGNDGTLVGAPTYAAGKFGSAMSFAGTADAVDLGNKAVWNPAGSFSVSLWAYARAWSTSWGYTMVGNRGESPAGWQIRRYSGTTSMCFTTRGTGSGVEDMASTAAMPQNQWVHLTCVYDQAANRKYIYINGILDSTQITTGAGIAASTHNTYIGCRANSGNTAPENWFNGMLDDIRIYGRALSADEADYLSQP